MQDVQFVDPKIFRVDRGANFSALSLMPLIPLNNAIAADFNSLPEVVDEASTKSRKSLVTAIFFRNHDKLGLIFNI